MAGNWNRDDKINIAKTFAVLATIQKSYGVEINAKTTLQAWEYILSDYTANQVCGAMEAWMKKDSSMPAPADLIKIMSPAPKGITTAEYIFAQKEHEREGFPMHGFYGKQIEEYEAENADERREVLEITSDRVQKVLDNSVKRIES